MGTFLALKRREEARSNAAPLWEHPTASSSPQRGAPGWGASSSWGATITTVFVAVRSIPFRCLACNFGSGHRGDRKRTLGPGFPVMPRGPLSPRGPWTDGREERSALILQTPRDLLPLPPGMRPTTCSRFWKAALKPKGGYRWASLSPWSGLPRCALESEKKGPGQSL